MADGWDDWGDDDNKSANGSDKSEGWDWPSTTAAAPGGQEQRQQQQQQSSAAVEEAEARDAAVDEMTEKYFVELRKYLEDLADPSVREEIGQELKKRDFPSLARYYDGRDDLAGYTLDTELRRMKYSVVAEDGCCLGGADAAAGEVGGTGVGAIRQFLSGRRDDAMLRMANQSIFADMLEAIQGRLLRPDLEISVVSRDCEFSLDFSKGVLGAQSLFEVSTVGSGAPGARETLEIAQIRGTVCVDTQNQTCSQRLLSPQLRMVFDDAMRASARVLALHSLMDGGMSDFGSGPGGGNSSSLDRMGSLRTSLARASSDGMGRAAAAGTGLLANVVAGVGSAIGASRTGGVDGNSAGGGGGGGRGDGSSSAEAAPLVQLYRRADTDEAPNPAGGISGPSPARTGAELSAQPSSRGREHGAAVSESAEVPGSSVGDGGMERRSALGVASATGGAVLRGLWGGVQSAAAAGVAVAARQGSIGGEAEQEPEFRLYRREGES